MQAVAVTVKKSLRLDFSQSDPVVAARNAFGVAIPLVIGIALGSVPIAVFGAVGALFASFADRPGSCIGLRMPGVDASEITATAASHYGETVLWAKAAHEAGFDGAVWMRHRCNADRAYVFFGDRVAASDLVIDPTWARAFGLEPDLTWLSDISAPLHISVGW